MQVHNLSQHHSILNTFIAELRDINIQNDRMRFRKNIERIGEILCYEMSRSLEFKPQEVKTPLGKAIINTVTNNVVICSVLRAGLPLHNGVLNYFDKANSAFISAYRHHTDNSDAFKIIVEYIACPDLQNKTLVLVDPMLATGQSLVLTYEALVKYGLPKQVHIISVIGSKQGVAYAQDKFPKNTHLWISAIDDKLNEKGYIVPGLGDAGDLAYGSKLQH